MKKIRILFCRYTVDGHDRGVLTVMSRCRDAGMEVIYIHFHDVREIVKTAEQEDADMIAVTSSMGQHFFVMEELMETLKDDQFNIPVIIGGVIPTDDVDGLVGMGAEGVFGPGSSPEDAVGLINRLSAAS